MGKRVIPGNTHHVQTVAFGPGATSVAIATAMALATNTFSPMAAGVHSHGTQPRGYSGLSGYGVNRFGTDVGARQAFHGAVAKVVDPASRRLGFGAMVSGQPGLPQSGQDASGLAYLGLGNMGNIGMGA